jgi:hypothetical protein
MSKLMRVLLVFVLAAATLSATASNAAASCGITPYGLIGNKWYALGGEGSPLGCATEAEHDTPGRNGRTQTFQFGQIVWAPDQGPNMVVATWSVATRVFVDWGPTDPLSYDFFIVRWDLNGSNIGQTDIENGPRTYGSFSFDSPQGWSSVVLEGCDSHVVGSSTCRQGWTAPSATYAAPPGPIYISAATNPAHAFDGLDQRRAAAVEHLACTRLLNPGGAHAGEGEGVEMTAQLEMARRYGSGYHCRGQLPSVQLVNQSLMGTGAHPTGSSFSSAICSRDGDYDTFLKGLMVVIYKYWDLLYPATRTHILNDLLTENGPHSVDDEKTPVCGYIDLPESENHRLLIESARYLSNQKLYDATGNAAYDNVANGERNFLLGQLQNFAKFDFLEYNARPYQRYSMDALLNLFDYARDPAVRTGARIVLDYTTTKFALSSNQLRRAGPYRRLTPRTDAANQSYYVGNSDPLTAFFLLWTGLSGNLGNTIPDWFTEEAVIAGLSSYLPPQAAVYRAMNKATGPYQETFFGGNRPQLSFAGEDAPPGIEIYSSSPSFLLTAGGVWLPSGYGRDEWYERIGTNENYGVPQSTTLMPSRNHPSVGMVRDNFIRFDGYSGRSPAGRDKVNTCVSGGFACGLQLQVPQVWQDCAESSPYGVWRFLNLNTAACGYLGFYVAIHGSAPTTNPEYGNVGFFDAAEASSMSFADFRTNTINRNSGIPNQLDPHNEYTFGSADGHYYSFRLVSPSGFNNDPLLTWVDGHQLGDFGSFPLVQGPYLNSPGHDGYLELWWPEGGVRTVLDFRDALNPVIR